MEVLNDNGKKESSSNVVHKIPSGEGPYARAKHLQMVDKNLDASIVWFWKAINSRDRVESALKDMAVVMKQLDRADEAVEAIKSWRHLCTKQSQESLDNVLIDLYKKCGRVDEQIDLLKQKLRLIYKGEAFNGKTKKTARSHGKKFQVSITQETARLLGNLGWAYMQKTNYMGAEAVYRKAQMIEPNANNACNLGLCLIKQGQLEQARQVLVDVLSQHFSDYNLDKTINRAKELLDEVESIIFSDTTTTIEEVMKSLDFDQMDEWSSYGSKRLPVFEELTPFRDQIAC